MKGTDIDSVVQALVLERIAKHLRTKEEPSPGQELSPGPELLAHPLVHLHARARLR